MTASTPKDISASVRQRLTNHASKSKEDFQVVLAQYGFERLLYRLCQSPHADPPYLIPRGHEYIIDANYESFHMELLSICNKCKCMILVSSYNVDLYNTFLTPKNGWRKRSIATRTRGTTGRDHLRTEILWENRHFTKAVKSGHVPVRLSFKEGKNNKINPSR